MAFESLAKRSWFWPMVTVTVVVGLAAWPLYRWSGHQALRLGLSSRSDAAVQVLAARGVTPSSLTVHLAATERSAGLRAVQVSRAETLYIHEATVLTSSDVASASVGRNAYGAPTLRLALTPQAASRFRSFTADHIRERLVFLAGDRVLMAPFIAGPPTSNVVEVESSLTLAEVRELAAKLSAR